MARWDRYGGRAIFVGNLPIDVREKELDEIFYKFGRIRMVDIKKPARPPGFAFIEFEDPRSAEEAARRRNNYEFAGLRMRVEIARGGESAGAQQPLRVGYRPIRNTMGFRLYVKGLPRSASWQDLKDFIRRVCKPLYTEVFKDHRDNVLGVVEFESKEDMKAALRKLDDSEFTNPFDKGHYVRLVEDLEERGRSRSRSPRRERERARDRSRSSSSAGLQSHLAPGAALVLVAGWRAVLPLLGWLLDGIAWRSAGTRQHGVMGAHPVAWTVLDFCVCCQLGCGRGRSGGRALERALAGVPLGSWDDALRSRRAVLHPRRA